MKYYLPALIGLSVIISACGGDDSSGNGLSEFEKEHGVGPITEAISLDELDRNLADRGQELFEAQCTACHQLEAPITGPALGEITQKREPAFIMNYILNPREMREKHPVAQQLSEDYPGVMNDLGLDKDEAKAIVVFLAEYAGD